MTLKSWSQMLFRKVQKSQQNMLSTSLKVKKVTSRHSDLVLRKIKLSTRLKRKLPAQYSILNFKVKRSARADKRRFVMNLASEAAASSLAPGGRHIL